VNRPPNCDDVPATMYQVHVYDFIDDTNVNAVPIVSEKKALPLDGDDEYVWTSVNLSSMVTKWKNDNEPHSLLVHAVPVHAAVPAADILDTGSYSMDELNNRAHKTHTCSHDMVVRGSENGHMLVEMSVRDYGKLTNGTLSDPPVDECTSSGGCCRVPLRVDFTSIGHDWIIAPKWYDAYYCSGQCRATDIMSDPGSHVRAQLAVNVTKCCSPKSMSGIKIMYKDIDGNAHNKIIPNMVVQSCGCR